MKKLYLYIIALNVIALILLPHAVSAQDLRHFEAEDGLYNKLEPVRDSSASGHSYLKMKNEGDVSWNVRLEKSGWYNIIVRYRALDGEKEEYVLRNGYTIPVGFEMAKEWNLCRTKTFLQEGENRIGIKKSWGNIDLDYMEVSPADVHPEISPKNNIFYKESPYDITVKINRYGYKLQSVSCSGKALNYEMSGFPDFEDAVNVRIPKSELLAIAEGKHIIKFNFDNGYSVSYNLEIKEKIQTAVLNIIVPDVEHGNSVIIILPSGKVMLVDCAKAWVRDSILIPLLQRHNIKTIDYMILTHYHGDHDSDDKGMKIRNMFKVKNFYDYKSFTSGDTFNIDGVKFKVLNSYGDGNEENSRSLSFKMEYNGFVYVHGADTYADNQKKILRDFPNDIRAHVFFANHHFHGSADTEYLRAVDPCIVLLQAEKAIYARSTYMVNFTERVAPYLKENRKRFVEILPCLEVGTVVIRVNGGDDWTYESYRDTGSVVVPFLERQK